MLLVLPAGKPLAHAGQAPHGPAVALLALPLVGLLAVLDELDVGNGLHAAYARLQLLREEKNHQNCDLHTMAPVTAFQRLLENHLWQNNQGRTAPPEGIKWIYQNTL